MTTSCARSFVAQLPEDYHVEAITNHQAPTAIQGPEDGDAAVPGVLNIISNGNFDAYVIACFDDTGLAEARTITQKPVIGIGQASFHLAALSSGRFSVLTTLAVSIPVIAENIEAQGFGPVCDGVYASGVPVLDLPYVEDSTAEVDMNVVMLRPVGGGESRFVEVQGTAEGVAFSRNELDQLLQLADSGLNRIFDLQSGLLSEAPPARPMSR